MTNYELWRKMINAKVYNKQAVTTRVNAVFAVGQINVEEYTQLIELIGVKYTDVE